MAFAWKQELLFQSLIQERHTFYPEFGIFRWTRPKLFRRIKGLDRGRRVVIIFLVIRNDDGSRPLAQEDHRRQMQQEKIAWC